MFSNGISPFLSTHNTPTSHETMPQTETDHDNMKEKLRKMGSLIAVIGQFAGQNFRTFSWWPGKFKLFRETITDWMKDQSPFH